MNAAQVLKCTPVLIVEAIEASLPFWQERLGFERPIEVPDGDGIGFAMLTNGKVEIMYQTAAMVEKDANAYTRIFHNNKTLLFIEVEDIDAIDAALQGCEIVLPRRETFYGSLETGYREPGGHCVTFAQFKR